MINTILLCGYLISLFLVQNVISNNETFSHSNTTKSSRRGNKLIINTESGFLRGRAFNLDEEFQEINVDSKMKKKSQIQITRLAWYTVCRKTYQ